MEYIKVAKVDDVILHKRGIQTHGTLHLTTHHLIFTSPNSKREFWLPFHIIHSVFKNKGSANYCNNNNGRNNNNIWKYQNIKIITKDLLCFSIDFKDCYQAQDVFDSIKLLTVIKPPLKLYCFLYRPNQLELPYTGKTTARIYDIRREFFDRQGLDPSRWRVSNVNSDFKFCPTYPNEFIVPFPITDTLLKHASKYRSSQRIPVLSYYHKETGCCIVRSAQPLPGLTQQRSPQDERLIYEFFQIKPSQKNVIVDCRPTTNAYAQTALGGGTENMDNYNFGGTTTRMFLGIPNIHTMRDSFQSLIDNLIVDNDINSPLNRKFSINQHSSWHKHIKTLLNNTEILVKYILFNKGNLLIHCSDGWDRTTQISSLVQLCIDPYYRTYEGFMVLVEKEWVLFGHRFLERCGHYNSNNNFHDNSSNNIIKSSILGNSNVNNNGSNNNNSNNNSNDNNNDNNNDNDIISSDEMTSSSEMMPVENHVNNKKKDDLNSILASMTNNIFGGTTSNTINTSAITGSISRNGEVQVANRGNSSSKNNNNNKDRKSVV
ncbi:related to Phosphoinositide 3-phosphatase [Saccharomycodes ludwigii]|uniref:Related to Phosphoinositide 3-phosphatase n=1 Tax=Saccharomycodes ludwigii TaxID=36035 RepID=A0A376B5C4_9ASCO|nr:related to Phosphoinositide 3-phosphatase [Saccharomycodes ludwigii]